MKSPYDKNRYRKGAHTVLDLQYHFVWKTKYGYSVLNGDLAARARDILREICSQYDITISRGNVRSNHIYPTNLKIPFGSPEMSHSLYHPLIEIFEAR
jgi:hypothetical protein